MTKVAITTSLLDDLADAISTKTGEATPMSIGDMTDIIEAITRRSGTDLSASGATVTVPAGLYSAQATKSVASGTAGTPSASKSVSGHTATITPSVTNTSGYITSSTKTGTAVTVTASELVSGTKSITSNGSNIDVTEYAAVDVAVPSSTPSLQSKSKSYTPTTSQQSETVSADTGYDGLSSVAITVAAMPSGTATAPSTITGSSATVSTGTNTLTLSKTVSVTPTVSAGYVSSGTAGNSNVSLTASVTTQAAQTIHPSTTQQTIASGRYLTGTQTIAPVTTTNLTADNIKSGVTVQVGDASDSDCVASVTGTYSGGGGSSMNVQTAQSTTRSTSTSGSSVISLTCSKAGTYTVRWSTFRSSTSGTWGSRLYIGGTAHENMNTSGWSNHIQNREVTGVSINANQAVAVYVQSRGSNYYGYVGTLTIIQTA